jgi:hypothetical protein
VIPAINLKVGETATDQLDFFVCHLSLRNRGFLSRAPFATSISRHCQQGRLVDYCLTFTRTKL